MQTTTSIWEDSLLTKCDVAIIGGGFLGMWSAYHLKRQNPKLCIHIYERDTLGLGASTRNAGFSCFGTLGEFISDTELSTPEKALRSLELRYLGVQEIIQFSRRHNLDIGYEAIGGYEILKKEEFAALEGHIQAVNGALQEKLKLEFVFTPMTMEKAGLPFNPAHSLIYNPYEGGVNSAKLLFALQRMNEIMGIKIFHGIEVKAIEGTTLKLENSLRSFDTQAQTVVVALNAFASRLLPEVQVMPGRGQIIWCDNLELNFKGTFHFHEGYYYFRTIGDDQLLIGGARHLDIAGEARYEFESNGDIVEHLLDYVHTELNLPEFRIKKHWQGIMGFTADKQPVIKEVQDNVWHLHACNGMGVAMTPIIAKEFAQQFVENH